MKFVESTDGTELIELEIKFSQMSSKSPKKNVNKFQHRITPSVSTY